MDESGAFQHNPYWEQLMPRYTNNPPSGNVQSQWNSFSPTLEASSYLSNRPTGSTPHDAFPSNNRPTPQHRRWNFHPPYDLGAINTPVSSLSSREYHNLNTPPLPELRNPQPDPSRQLPGIETLTQDFNPAEFPASDLSWGSFGDDSLFDGDLWPELPPNSFDTLINSNNNNNNNTITNTNTVNNDHFVDLTVDASSPLEMPPVTRKHRSSVTDPHVSLSTPSRGTKRPRLGSLDVKREDVNVECLDLVDVDDDGGLSKVLERQQAAAIKEQQGPQGEVPTKLSNLQCIICMEPMTDMTVTHCGHIFCHTCIMEALIAGENQGEPGKGTSKCPVCRKKVARPKEKSRDKREVIPIEIKVVSKRSLDKGKAKE
ncbi:MAG: hypothetical protein Q9200_006868 [Gallowayella weberi]